MSQWGVRRLRKRLFRFWEISRVKILMWGLGRLRKRLFRFWEISRVKILMRGLGRLRKRLFRFWEISRVKILMWGLGRLRKRSLRFWEDSRVKIFMWDSDSDSDSDSTLFQVIWGLGRLRKRSLRFEKTQNEAIQVSASRLRKQPLIKLRAGLIFRDCHCDSPSREMVKFRVPYNKTSVSVSVTVYNLSRALFVTKNTTRPELFLEAQKRHGHSHGHGLFIWMI